MNLKAARCIGLCALVFLLGSSSAYAKPVQKNRQYYEERGEIVWEVPTHDKLIALTFDDGPDPVQTPQILALLEQYQAKGTFFVLGKWAEKFPDLIKQEQREGHEIANHTYAHTYAVRSTRADKYSHEMNIAEKSIVGAGAQRPTLFRPPGGYYNDMVIQVAKQQGYTIVLWSWHQDTRDWASPGVSAIVNKVLKNARNGDIVLFHDKVEGKSQTVAALKTILPKLQEQGYRFVTVSELLAVKAREAAKDDNPSLPQHP
ncbi:polysaccharide deacetylase family protein [Paenibacillus taichungensis]|uniref:Polysaccharide deacetylase family protein n=1 Tax=Paenibacillus taichungensis TaxID=484184 RepID=A0ABX2MK88_9BACL|nr:polysaccharide deacetylase family protein [Paenibacillus taichungensis]MDR9744940.1 polysaccharide deacetylase family protein [Paenibacillus taichungensis]NUU54445.1 polysaccharide deacetylase family protein [Paenibacillus taichungensis]